MAKGGICVRTGSLQTSQKRRRLTDQLRLLAGLDTGKHTSCVRRSAADLLTHASVYHFLEGQGRSQARADTQSAGGFSSMAMGCLCRYKCR